MNYKKVKKYGNNTFYMLIIQMLNDFLEKLLADGQMPQTEIMELAEKKGIAEKTLRNAKEALNVKSKRLNNQWYWSLD